MREACPLVFRAAAFFMSMLHGLAIVPTRSTSRHRCRLGGVCGFGCCRPPHHHFNRVVVWGFDSTSHTDGAIVLRRRRYEFAGVPCREIVAGFPWVHLENDARALLGDRKSVV